MKRNGITSRHPGSARKAQSSTAASRRRPKALAGSIAALLAGLALWLPADAPASPSIVLYDNLTQPITSRSQINTGGSTLSADSFSTGSSAVDLTTVTVALNGNADGGTVTVSLAANSSTAPGTTLTTIGTVADSSLPANPAFTDFTLTLSTPYALTANTMYWIVLTASDGGGQWAIATNGMGTGVAGEFLYVSGSASPTSSFAYLMEVQATAVTTVLPATYWLGGASGAWTGANWASDATGTATTATPTSTDDVTFSATGAGNQGNTTLGANFTIHSLTINDSAAVTINAGGAFTLTISGNAGTGITVNSGAGLLTINANVTFAGSSNTITVSNTAGAVIDGVIGGGNGLTKAGTGTLTLGAANNYTGATTISAGTIQLGVANALPTGTALSVSGTLNLAGFNQQVGSLSGSGIITDSGTAATFTVTGGGAFSGNITGANTALTVGGTSQTLTLSGNNTYGGQTTINSTDTLHGSATALTGATSVSNSGTLDLNANSISIGALNGSGSVINSGAAGTLTVTGGGNFSGNITGASTALTVGGPSQMLTLSGNNTYSGQTTINSTDTLQAGSATALTGATSVSDSGTLDLNGHNISIGALSGSASGTVMNSGGAGTLTVTGGGSFSGNITGSTTALTVGGVAQTLTLSGNNTYGGLTTINGGDTLKAGSATALTGATSVSDSGTLDLNGHNISIGALNGSASGTVMNSGGAGTLTVTGGGSFSGNITGANTALTVGGTSQTLTLSGDNTYSGLTTINSTDTLKAGSATALTGATSVSDSGTLDLNANSISIGALNGPGSVIDSGAAAILTVSGGGSFSGNITGANTALTVGGTSQTLTLSGDNTYGGLTTINSTDTLKAGSATALTSATSVSDSGTLDLNANNISIGALNGSGSVIDSGAAAILTVSGGGSFSGNITGANTALTVGGTSQTLTLSGNNTYSGLTTINSTDTLKAGSATALTGATSMSDSGTLDLNANSISIGALNGSGSVINSGAAAILTVSGGGSFSGNITGVHTALTVGGTSQTLTLSGNNTYGGLTTINSTDTLQAGSATALTGATSVSDSGTLDLNGHNISIGALNGSGSVINSSAAATLTVTGGGSFSGNIAGANTALAVLGPSQTLTLSGSNTYGGVTTVTEGTLSVSSLANGGVASNIGAASNAAGNLVLNGGTLQYTGNSVTIDRGLTASNNSVIDVSTSGQTLTMSGAVNVNGGGSGGSGLIIMGNLTLTGTVSLDNSPSSNNALNIAAGATLTTSGTVTNPVGNNVVRGGTLIVSGGTFTTDAITALGNAPAISGSTLTVSGGVFDQSGGAFLLGQSDASTVNLNGGTFETAVQLQSSVAGNTLSFNGGTLQLSASLANLVSAPADVTMTVNSGGAVIDVNGHTLTISNALLAGAGSGGLTLNSTAGGGTLTLSGASTYTGATTINAGTIADGINNALPTGTALSVTGALDLAGHNQQVASVTGSGTVTDSGVAATFTVNNASADSFAGTITGTNLALVKQGSGALTLGGASTYSGTTDIQAGVLQVNGSLGNTAVTVESGATLGGSGSIGGAVTILSGGILAPGDPTTLTVGALTLNSGSITNYQLGTPGVIGSGVNDLTVVTGNLTLGGTLNITSTGSFGPGAYQLFQYNGTFTNNTLAIGTVPATYSASNFIVVTGVAKEVDLIVVPNGGAATLQFWDGATTTGDTTIHGGSGTWSNFTTNFADNAGNNNATWQNGIAVFATPSAGPGASTVTLSGAINFSGLMFMGDGYTIVSDGAAGTSFTAIGTPTNSTNVADISTSTGVTATIDAVIGGSAGISKSGAGTLILNGVNTYSGGTTINAGVLSIGNSSALSSGPVSVGTGGELNAAATMALTNEVTFASTGSSTVSAAGGMVFSLSSVDLAGGNAVFGSASNAGTVVIGSLTTAVVTAGSTIEVAYGTLQNGGGATNLSNLTTNAASTTVDSAGTLDVNDNTMEVKNLQGAGKVTLGSNAATVLTVDAGSFSGIISGAGQLTSTGALTLTGANTYSGGTAITGGTLTLGDGHTAGASLGSNTVVISGGATLTLDLASGETFSNSVTDSGHVVADDSPTSNYTISSTITGGGDFTKTGGNTVTVTGGNNYLGTTTISGGTLQLGDGVTTGASLGANTVIVSGGATLTLDLASGETFSNSVTDSGHVVADGPSNNYTISSPITGAGDFTKTGANTVTLTGNNSYQGGTAINGGTLLVNSTAGSGPVVVNSGGTLGGSGLITGAVTLNSSGTIAPGAGSPGVAGTTLNAASLTWNGGAALTLQLGATAGDQLALAGALTKGTATVGAYTLNISNAGIAQTDYTLATFTSTNFAASDFTLALPAGFSGILLETTSSLDLVLAFSATGPVIQNTNPVGTPLIADFTVTGPVTTGTSTQSNTINSLIFTPGGTLTIFNTLTLTSGKVSDGGGTSSITGGTLSGPSGLLFNLIGEMVVNSELQGNLTKTGTGSLILNGALFGNAQVLQGLLGGTGSISGTLTNNGTVAPGDAPGTLSVGGNYAPTHTSSLVIEVGGRQPGQFDVLAVGGKASLDGTLQLVQLNNFTLGRGDKITFLTAGQGVSGTFASVINPFVSNTILEPMVIYGPNSVALEAVQGSFKTFAQNTRLPANEISVGGALDSVVSDSRANALINYLDARGLSDLAGDLEKIDAEQLTSMFTVGIALANVQSMNIQRRADDIRSGSSGFSAAGFAMNGASPGYSGGFDITTGVAGPAGPDGKESKEAKEAAPVDQRWGAFLSGTGQWVNVGDTNNARGYNLESGGFTLGVDYKVCEHFAVGLSFGYTGTTADLADRGRIFVNGGKMGVYTTTFVGGWYADAAVNGGYNGYETRRSALQGQASGSADGGELNAVFGTGYDFKKDALTFGPTATFNYTYVGLDDFTEHGSLAPLNIHGGDEESLRTALGFKVKYDWKVGGVLIKPELRAAWQHEFGNTTYSLDSNFADGAGGAFPVSGPKIGRDSALLSGGFAVQCSERCSAYVYYDGELGRANYHSSSVSGGFRTDF